MSLTILIETLWLSWLSSRSIGSNNIHRLEMYLVKIADHSIDRKPYIVFILSAAFTFIINMKFEGTTCEEALKKCICFGGPV